MGLREFFEVIDSTQDRAIERARSGAPLGACVVAASQRRGKGRADHTWWSPSGAGVYLSVLTAAPPVARTLLPLAVAVELRAVLRLRFGLLPSIKWPNDLVVVGDRAPPRKLAGILVDEVPSPTVGKVEVVGVGLNVRSPTERIPPALAGRHTSIQEWVQEVPPTSEIESWTVEAALRAVDRLRAPPAVERVVEECRSALFGVGRPAIVDGKPSGTIDTLGEEGELVLVRDGGRVAIRTGDVEVGR